jgi:DNA-binding NarL/FixJ family response regulator
MKVLIIDDQPLFRKALTRLITSKTLKVVGEAYDSASAHRQTLSLLPDLTILDLNIGGRAGLGLITDLKANHPPGRILVYSSQEEKIYARRAIKAGAHGYVMKRSAIKCLRDALAKVVLGELYVSESIQQVFMGEIFSKKRKLTEESLVIQSLSNRELQILHLLGTELSSSQMAAELNLSIKTISTYRERLKDKLNLESSSKLVEFAAEFLYNANMPKAKG